jgi:hypothetical protein
VEDDSNSEEDLQLDLELELEMEEPQLEMEEARAESDDQGRQYDDDPQQGDYSRSNESYPVEDDNDRLMATTTPSSGQYGFAEFDDVLLSKSSLLQSLQNHSQPADDSVSSLARAVEYLDSRSNSDRDDRSERSYSSDDEDLYNPAPRDNRGHDDDEDDDTADAKQLIREFWQQV